MDAQEQDLWADADEEKSDFWTRRAFHAFTVTVIVAASEHRAASAALASAVVELGRCCCALRVVSCSCGTPSPANVVDYLKWNQSQPLHVSRPKFFLAPRLCQVGSCRHFTAPQSAERRPSATADPRLGTLHGLVRGTGGLALTVVCLP